MTEVDAGFAADILIGNERLHLGTFAAAQVVHADAPDVTAAGMRCRALSVAWSASGYGQARLQVCVSAAPCSERSVIKW